jgi:hypothetical protein
MAALLVKDSFGINERVLNGLAVNDEGWKKIADLWNSVKFKRLDSLTPDQIESLETVEMDVQEHESMLVYRSMF